ncbi:AraC family transcriptional regulator [Flavobacterium sp. NG2]|uniref:helix-turn-helix domain-containing protein n=1 Tax=Flavobacterium sp. NG2 TaxID=3097547 RepID=UPI002A83F2B5|nr:AraC family transcriptional regulator [Flavobacterium sp. NG2]WPR72759.1 AraC family transcriptional regulator [Flavobacterium sp. NG2]
MKIYIKNMVCNRCIAAVKTLLEQQGILFSHIQLGEVTILRSLTESQKQQLSEELKKLGFELLNDKTTRLMERIKTLIIENVHYNQEKLKVNLSDYLVEALHQDYSSLSKLFSETEGITIEHYYILQKIERVKELLVYNELTLSEIAFQLNYSSVAHLSNQFKKVTGFTPTYFKNLKDNKRKQIDEL